MKLKLRQRTRIALRKVKRLRRFSRRRRVSPAIRIVGGLGLMVLVGTILLLLPGVSTRRLSFIEALFTATSALSVTGLTIINPGLDLTLFGKIILLGLIQVGGIGFMVVAVVSFRLLGRRVELVDRLALCDSLGLVQPGAVVHLTRQVLQAVVIMEACGALLLWLHWRNDLGNQQAIFFAIFHAVSAFCNAGFDLFGSYPDLYPLGPPNDNISLLIMGSLVFLGGLGIPVFANIIGLRQGQRVSLHTKITLITIISLTSIGGIGIFLAEYTAGGGVLAGESWMRQMLLGFFQSVSARTAGFSGIQPFEAITPASQLLLLVLMFIGASPASMGGGITTGTFAVLMLSIWSYARNLPAVQIGKRSIGSLMVRKAAAVLTISAVLVCLATWVILATHDATLNVAIFEVISAFATCGLTLNFTSELNLFGRIVIIVMMFWGRLGALTIITAVAQQRPVQLVEYPEETILIG
jgi:trk system potassium uptake protein TrkH